MDNHKKKNMKQNQYIRYTRCDKKRNGTNQIIRIRTGGKISSTVLLSDLNRLQSSTHNDDKSPFLEGICSIQQLHVTECRECHQSASL